MKKIILTIFVSSLFNILSAQNLQLKGDSILSSSLGDWQKYNGLYLKTNYVSPIFYKYILTVYDNEYHVVIQTDSMIEDYDSIGPGDTLHAELLFNSDYTAYNNTFGDYYQQTYRLKAGDYTVKIKFYDSNFSYIGDSASKQITVKDQILPALLYPTDNIELLDSTINLTVFNWLSPKLVTSSSISYLFRIFEIDSSQIDSLEYGFNNNVSVYDTIIIDTFHIVPIDLMHILDSNKWYGWSVKTFLGVGPTDPMISNKGISYPFLFSKSSLKRGDNNLCCTDGLTEGFEDGTMNGWIPEVGVRVQLEDFMLLRKLFNQILYPIGKFDWVGGSLSDRIVVENFPGVDPVSSIPKVPTNGGIHSLRLGNHVGDGQAHRIKRTITVTDCNSNFKLRYALIGRGGGHKKINNSVFAVLIYKGRSNDILDNIERFSINMDETRDYSQSSGDVHIFDWNCLNIPLQKYMGQTITIQIIASDCPTSGHPTCAYIDFCGDATPDPDFTITQNFCGTDQPIVANGSNSKGLLHWQWTVQPCNAFGVGTGTEIISDWRSGHGAESAMNMNSMIINTGAKCGYFRIKLAGNNDCSGWTEEVKIIHISCPALGTAGNDKCCPSGICNIQIGGAPSSIAGYSYSWSPTNCLSNPYIANPYFNTSLCFPNPFISTNKVTYTVTVTDNYGCTSTDEVDIYSQPPTIISITQDSTQNLCDLVLIVSGADYNTVDWSWYDPVGNVTKHNYNTSFVFPRYQQDVTVTVTLTNVCGNTSSTTLVKKRQIFKNLRGSGINYSNYYPIELIYPNVINTTSSTIENRYLTIYEFGLDVDAPNAYYAATDAKLDILHAWGGIANIWTYENQHFTNGQFKWNGYVGGSLYPSGEVNWRLSLKNCNNREWVTTHRTTEKTCNTYKWVRAKGTLYWRKECQAYTTTYYNDREWILLYVNP